ncbi:PAS domain S-box protein [Breoghania sp. L-A4]|nr:PAS domain S-box protein [Breoghania sp. L-A4]
MLLLLTDDSVSRIRQANRVFWVEVTALLVALTTTTILIFSYGASPGTALPSYSFLPFALLIWSALRLGPRTTALACLTFSLVALWFDTSFVAAGTGDGLADVGALGVFLLIATVSALSSAAVIAESRSDTERLAESERKLREVMKLAPIGIYVADKEKYSFTNPAGAKIVGLSSPEEIVGKSVMSFYPPEGQAAAQQRIDSLVDEGSGSRPRMVNTVVDADGNRRVVEAMATAIRWEGRSSFLVMVNDISGRKQAEDAMMRAQKMEAVGQLSGGIAHDFNNILGIIIGNLELVQDMAADRPEISERIELALKSVNRGASITHKLLSFSRQKTQATKLTSLNAIIDNMQELISRSLTAAITVENRLADNLWMVDVDPGEFQDALINLALNARDAMPEGGSLVIAAENTKLDAEYVKLNPLAREGEFVMISVADTGVGMEPDVVDKIFEPFFSTKGEGKGSGLGLSMVYGFVQRSGGHIKVETHPGKGATFRIYLPRARRTVAEASPKAQTPVAMLRGTETILIVDDEADFTDIAAHNLGFLGYTVLSASNGSEALEILRTNPYIDLLFSDVVMPGGQDGYQLAVEAHKMFPELKILLTSGYTQRREHSTSGDETFIAKLASELLSKPYNRRQLAGAIRRALDAGG